MTDQTQPAAKPVPPPPPPQPDKSLITYIERTQKPPRR